MTDFRPDDQPEDQSDKTPSEGGSGFGGAETSAGGADAVPETPDNVPADGAE